MTRTSLGKKTGPKARKGSKTIAPSDGPGGQSHQPTETTERQVRNYVIAGYKQEDIASRLDIDAKTLRKHYRLILDTAMMDQLSNTAVTAFQLAQGRPAVLDEKGREIREELKPEIAAVRYVLRTQGRQLGWAERLELTGANGEALFKNVDLSLLSDDEFNTFIALCNKVGLRFPGSAGNGAAESEPSA